MIKEILKAENLTKTFGDFVAVDGLSFAVHKDEIFGFLGPNGAGKTTTINMLTGLARPTAGSIFFDGTDYTGRRKKAQEIIGIVPDESNLYEEMDGFENLCFCAALYGLRKAEREYQARRLLEQFNLAEAGRKPYKSYSKGMKRKLTIAAGIIHQPAILFLDEPTTGIDVASARQIRALIRSLNEGGTTIFMTTHYIEEAERLCHRIAFIVRGRIVRTGEIGELMADAQKDQILQFSFAGDVKLERIEADFQRHFGHCRLHHWTGSIYRVHSAMPLDLMPFISFFDARAIKVMEAKIVHPSLEEIFVRITGIEQEVMKKEKEGRKK